MSLNRCEVREEGPGLGLSSVQVQGECLLLFFLRLNRCLGDHTAVKFNFNRSLLGCCHHAAVNHVWKHFCANFPYIFYVTFSFDWAATKHCSMILHLRHSLSCRSSRNLICYFL